MEEGGAKAKIKPASVLLSGKQIKKITSGNFSTVLIICKKNNLLNTFGH